MLLEGQDLASPSLFTTQQHQLLPAPSDTMIMSFPSLASAHCSILLWCP